MPKLVIDHVSDETFCILREQANRRGRTMAEEAEAILSNALNGQNATGWERVDDIYHRLLNTGRDFSDSAELVREDRER